MSFTSIPILDLALARDPATKPGFLSELRHALMEVGFLYLKNMRSMVNTSPLTLLPLKAEYLPRLKIEMKNAPSFLGYSRLSAEVTAGAIDNREQIDLSTEHPVPGPDAPRYYNLLAPNQWPSPEVLSNFRPIFTEYMKRMGAISIYFTSLIAEAIELPSGAFNKYFDADQQHKLKIVKYPDVGELGAEGSPHRGLQVQNMRGAWIDCPPIAGTLVVAIGQGLEALTGGVCASTTHRVLSPAAGAGARYSIPFFQGVSGDARFADLETVGVGAVVPAHVRAQREAVLRANGGRLDEVEFTFRGGGVAETLGEATLRNRVKSHPDVGERWYPDILESIREQQRKEAAAAAAATPAVVG
ncbi:hypothetical protein CHGG_01699 [Chaetomium globosum CBS 148.51]|uniref:Fe2OG dioxygenase domain-containing protein n=1 Tax=Chaetomium globosum (strain ATCC 6205 / CBS 148.51 / DSM 1962 / NBRC 6347 / NRRL 1970) TaxID=306901 RepID=Q2HDK5_CHAGB|nr:uncharacterized protein CHGG_01699 [Chaetomium globosum CBS 148.51]EAQ93464.1 hypothetical protein CHGG_01699 [Chaetomium globosum CBS 148.51]